jgi:uncharacterized membrane protein YfcA
MLSVWLGLTAVAVGCLASMVGVGGGFLVVPMLVLVWGLSMQNAAGTSLLMIVFTSTSSTLAYSRQKRVDYKLGVILAMGTIPGALAGAYVTSLLESELLEGLLGIFLLGLAVRMLLARELPDKRPDLDGSCTRKVDAHGHVFEYNAKPSRGFPGSFLAGMVSGTFGIGGGTLIVPLLRLGLRIPMHIAVPTSMFMMIFTSLAAGATHAALGHARLEYAIPLIVGIVIGTQIGARLAKRTKARVLEKLLGFCLLVVGFKLVLVFF